MDVLKCTPESVYIEVQKIRLTIENILNTLLSLSMDKVQDNYSRLVCIGGPRSAKTQRAYNVIYEVLNSKNVKLDVNTLKTLIAKLNNAANPKRNRVVESNQDSENIATANLSKK